MNLPEFHQWCRENGISYRLFYEESIDWFDVETISPAPAERVEMRKVCDFARVVMAIEAQIQAERGSIIITPLDVGPAPWQVALVHGPGSK